MATLVPRPDAIQAFQTLVRSGQESFDEIYLLALNDQVGPDNSGKPQGWRRDIWYDIEGQPQMQAGYGMRQLLHLAADLRRLRLAKMTLDASGTRDLVSVPQDSTVQHDLAIIWRDIPASTRKSILDDFASAAGAANEFLAVLTEATSRRSTNNGDSDEIDALIDRALEAIQFADSSFLALTELSRIWSVNERAQAQAGALAVRQSWMRALDASVAVAIDNLPQLRTAIDHLLSRHLLAPTVRVPTEGDAESDAWSAYPWYSVRARTAESRVMRGQEAVYADLREFFQQVFPQSQQVWQALLALLDQVLELWSIGPAALRRHLDAGFGWERAGGMANMIPGRPGTACHSVLLVVAQGTTLDRRLREARAHCIRCHDTTRLVLVITERWDIAHFASQNEPEFRALRDAFGLRLGALVRVGRGFTFQRVIE